MRHVWRQTCQNPHQLRRPCQHITRRLIPPESRKGADDVAGWKEGGESVAENNTSHNCMRRLTHLDLPLLGPLPQTLWWFLKKKKRRYFLTSYQKLCLNGFGTSVARAIFICTGESRLKMTPLFSLDCFRSRVNERERKMEKKRGARGMRVEFDWCTNALALCLPDWHRDRHSGLFCMPAKQTLFGWKWQQSNFLWTALTSVSFSTNVKSLSYGVVLTGEAYAEQIQHKNASKLGHNHWICKNLTQFSDALVFWHKYYY